MSDNNTKDEFNTALNAWLNAAALSAGQHDQPQAS